MGKNVRIVVCRLSNAGVPELEQELLSLGYILSQSVSGSDELLPILQDTRPDVCILVSDYSDLKASGELAIKGKALCKTAFIILTAPAELETVTIPEELSFVQFIFAPFTPACLTAGVESAVARGQASLKAEDEETWLSTILSSIAQALICVDDEGCIKHLNRAALGITGGPAGASIHKHIDDVLTFYAVSDAGERQVSVIEELAGAGKRCMVVVPASDEKIRLKFQVECTLLRKTGQKPLGFVLSLSRDEHQLSFVSQSLESLEEHSLHPHVEPLTLRDSDRSIFRRGKVLVYDDDPEVLSSIARSLSFLGLRVESVPSSKVILKAFQIEMTSDSPFDIVILDVGVLGEGASGEVARKIIELSPQSRIVATSSHSNDPVLADFEGHGFWGALKKPFRLNHLKNTMLKALKDR